MTRALFVGKDASGHTGLWATNGTTADTFELNVSGANAGGLDPQDLTIFANKAAFIGSDTNGASGLWFTDGTAVGTTELNLPTTDPSDLTAFGDKVLFFGKDSVRHFGLWMTDGTASGTTELNVSIPFHADAPAPYDLTVFDKKALYIQASQGTLPPGDRELWVTDGTAAGTHLLKCRMHLPNLD
jgi:ELWxxDGT repeat protein